MRGSASVHNCAKAVGKETYPHFFLMRRLANQPNTVGQEFIANQGIGGRGSPEKSMNGRTFISTVLTLVATALLFLVYLISLRVAIDVGHAVT
jgi:hypothetical protein